MVSRRLNEALAQNRRRRELPAFMARLHSELNLAPGVFRVLNLHDTQEVDRLFHSRITRARANGALQESAPIDQQSFAQQARDVLSEFGRTELVVLLSNWLHIGCIGMPADVLANHAAGLLHVDGDAVYGGTLQLERLFLFDYTRDTDSYLVLHCGTVR